MRTRPVFVAMRRLLRRYVASTVLIKIQTFSNFTEGADSVRLTDVLIIKKRAPSMA